MGELCRFGHHPEPSTDFCVEVEEIQSIHTNQKLGLTGYGHEEDYAGVDRRIEQAMQFRVGGTVEAVVSKAILREIEAERLSLALGEKQGE